MKRALVDTGVDTSAGCTTQLEPDACEKRRRRLPEKLIHFSNHDKKFHERWDEDRNMINFPHPYRCVMTGPPNCGKTTVAKNLMMAADPPFEKVHVIHADPENTHDYKECGPNVTMTAHIPEPADWPGDVKTMVIVDDMEQRELNKQQRKALDRLIGYVSTHKNISVVLCAQTKTGQAPVVWKCANVFVIWPSGDKRGMRGIGERVDLPDLVDLMKKICPTSHDSFWVDQTDHTPYPHRRNGYENLVFE